MGEGAGTGGRRDFRKGFLVYFATGLFIGACSVWASGPGIPRRLSWGAPSSVPQLVDLQALLPGEGESGAWTRDGDFREFAGDDLYLYVDGGAAIYQEYGFARVIAQDYRTKGGQGLSLEIFQMSTPEAAYGMYTFKRSAKGELVPVGTEGQLEDYYLNFWKGSFLVTITCFDKDGQGRRLLMPLALSVARKIPDGPVEYPPLVARLPRSRLLETSVRYFRGYLGFMNNYPSAAREDFRVQEGIRGDYSSRASLFILRYSGPEEALASLAAVEKTFRNNEDFRGGGAADGMLWAIDDKGKKVTIKVDNDYLLICIEDASGRNATGLFADAAKRLR
jgi:hypothetical protein